MLRDGINFKTPKSINMKALIIKPFQLIKCFFLQFSDADAQCPEKTQKGIAFAD
jgi:hypothetical protein